jgi:hypothetical protein
LVIATPCPVVGAMHVVGDPDGVTLTGDVHVRPLSVDVIWGGWVGGGGGGGG